MSSSQLIGNQFDDESDLNSVSSDIIFKGRGANFDLDDQVSVSDDTTSLASGMGFEHDDRYHELEEHGNYVSALPEHACAYCGIHSVSSVVKCVTCDKWFCNSRGGGSSSHIISHLVRARHKAVALHPDSELGDTTLECYNCGTKNVFVLGFISAKAETVVVILCRHPCASAPAGKELNWDTAQWDPLVVDRSFIPWLVSVPTAEEESRARKITPGEMAKLEDLWKENPYATADELNDPTANQEVPQVALRYDNGFEYQRIFGPLVALEAEYDRKQKESQSQGGVSVTWDFGLSQRYSVSFFTSCFDDSSVRIMIGDEMTIRYDGNEGPPWSANGFVIKIPDTNSEEVVLELQPGANPPTELTSNFSIDFVWSGITYDRIQYSLKQFAADEYSVSGYIYHKLLGHEVNSQFFDTEIPEDLSVPGIAELNESQLDAVTSVLRSPLSLIQGPPGTGKTVVSTSIVYHLRRMTKEAVLVCAPSNVAADQLADRIDKTGLNVVRLIAKSRENVISDNIKELSLSSKVFSDPKANRELVKLEQLKDVLGELSAQDRLKHARLLRKSEIALIENADVVVCTCSAAGDRRLSNIRFRTVLIDESTQATEPECLIPIVHGCKQLILVGDHQQLGPVVGYKPASNAGLSKSLFERLVVLDHTPIRLTVQYRMHPCLSEFPSNMFYDGSLQNGVTRQQRERFGLDFPWPVPENPMMFWSIIGQEEISSSGTSYLNRAEASNCEKLVTKFFKAGIDPSQIGIITPYEGQRAYLTQYMISTGSMDKELYKAVEVESVDAFQGREKDYIIVSCVRSNEHQGIGFLSDPRRLNVALTRAKYGLVLLGNPKVLSKNLLWLHLLTHFREKSSLVEGPINRLQPSSIQLHKPHAHRPRKKLSVPQNSASKEMSYTQNFPPLGSNGADFSGNGSFYGYGGQFVNDTASIDGDSVRSSHLASELFRDFDQESNAGTEVGMPISGLVDPTSLPMFFQQGFSNGNPEVPNNYKKPAENQTASVLDKSIGNSLSERLTKFLDTNDDDDVDSSDDDDLESVTTSFASQIGLY
ncbi:hypothetical protein DV495_003583 [Geotrichum candidum]|nr:hypothetical protein DV454_003699 [Geotrichum candidum]KAF5124982.1 hypothetical protein DV495_003583 [Geotrichum candidum]